MAQISGTTWTNSVANSISMATNIRESLEDVIWELDPMDTWALSNLNRTSVSNTYHEWLADALPGATANRQIEGDDASFSTVAGAQRLGNHNQISRKTFLISGTLEAVKRAGRKSEIARQGTWLMKQLKRDMEQSLVQNQASSAGGSATARSSASMESWLATNEVLATSTSSATTPGFSGGTVVSPTDGTTTGALTENALKSALELAWIQGGDPRVILAGSTQKKAIDAFTGIATRFVDSSPRKEAAIIGAANMYVSGFGSPHVVTLSRYVRSSVVLCIDPNFWAIGQLRAPFMEPLAKTGDGEKRQMIAEFCLISRNEKASAKVVACA
jgi:hypothetical protein